MLEIPYSISPPKEHPQVTAAVLIKNADKLHQSRIPEKRMGRSADRAEHHTIN
jgi:hypothetical protein